MHESRPVKGGVVLWEEDVLVSERARGALGRGGGALRQERRRQLPRLQLLELDRLEPLLRTHLRPALLAAPTPLLGVRHQQLLDERACVRRDLQPHSTR